MTFCVGFPPGGECGSGARQSRASRLLMFSALCDGWRSSGRLKCLCMALSASAANGFHSGGMLNNEEMVLALMLLCLLLLVRLALLLRFGIKCWVTRLTQMCPVNESRWLLVCASICHLATIPEHSCGSVYGTGKRTSGALS